MNRTSARSRLQLASQTLRLLSMGSLRQAAGGTSFTYVTPDTEAKGRCEQAKDGAATLAEPGGRPPAGG